MSRPRASVEHSSEPDTVMPKWLPQIVFGVAVYALVLTFGGAWWAASQSAAIAASRDFNARLEADVRSLQSKSDRLAVLEEKIGQISKTLEKMEAAMSRQPIRGKI
jgi:hypothetical protein